MTVVLDQDDLLALVHRTHPEGYLLALQDPGPGYELLEAYAAMFARVSTAVGRMDVGAYIVSASGGAVSTVAIHFARASAGAGAVTVKAGTIVQATASGRRFVLSEDAAFGALDLVTPSVEAWALVPAYEWDVPGPGVTAKGEAYLGDVDAIAVLIEDPAFGDPTVTVVQEAAADGGRSPMLDAHGEDRRLARLPGEGDSAYRTRVRRLPDTVSRPAMERALDSVFSPFSESAAFIETFEVTYQTVWDGPPDSVGDYDASLFAYDDPRDALPFRNRWLDDVEHVRAFIAVVPNLAAIEDVGMAYDDTPLLPSEHVSPHGQGRRAHAAYDVPETADPLLILAGGYDGFDLPKQALYRGLWTTFQRIKPAQTSAIVELEGQ